MYDSVNSVLAMEETPALNDYLMTEGTLPSDMIELGVEEPLIEQDYVHICHRCGAATCNVDECDTCLKDLGISFLK